MGLPPPLRCSIGFSAATLATACIADATAVGDSIDLEPEPEEEEDDEGIGAITANSSGTLLPRMLPNNSSEDWPGSEFSLPMRIAANAAELVPLVASEVWRT